MKKKILLPTLLLLALFSGCHESMDKRAQREAREYTEKYCPTPVSNFQRTDSVVFDHRERTFIYYCTLTDRMDDPTTISLNRQALHDGLARMLRQSPSLKGYKDAGIAFSYVLRSQKHPGQVLFQATFTAADLN